MTMDALKEKILPAMNDPVVTTACSYYVHA
jgi:hypothetical protein